MSAYTENIEKKVKNEYPEAWELLEKFRQFVRERTSEPINITIIAPDMTEEEEIMVYLEDLLKEGMSLEEAEKKAKWQYDTIIEAERKMDQMHQTKAKKPKPKR